MNTRVIGGALLTLALILTLTAAPSGAETIEDLLAQLREVESRLNDIRTEQDTGRTAQARSEAVQQTSVPVQSPLPAAAGQPRMEISAGADASWMSTYVWRGILLTDDPVLQPSATLASGALSLNFWGNMDLGEANDMRNKLNEADFTLDYAWGGRGLQMSSGIIRYTFPNTSFESTTELYTSIGTDWTGDTALSVYYDTGSIHGTYVSLSTGTSLPVPGVATFDLSGAVGWGSAQHNSGYYGIDEGLVSDVSASISSTFAVSSKLSVTPSVTYAGLMDQRIRDAFESADTKRDNFIWGLTMSASY